MQEVCQQNDEGRPHLWFCDVEAAWGEFDDLEAFLQKHGIPYTRRREGKCEYEPLVVEYRPGMKEPLVLKADNSGNLIAPLDEFRAVETKLVEAIQQVCDGSPTSLGSLGAALELLRKNLPPLAPPLEPFQIIPETS